MDMDISRWILEFILSQPLEDNILNAIIEVLPLPKDDVRLNKALILRRIHSEISNGSVSEKILKYLDLMEQLYYQEGVETSEAMKAAYCAVAVDCTVRFLGKETEKLKYVEAVGRIWKKRINNVTENVGVTSKELRNWGKEIEEAVWDDTCHDNLIMRGDSIVAVDAVKAFVKEAKERIGPSFLEVMAEALMRDDAVKACLSWESKDEDDESRRRTESLSSAGQDLAGSKHDLDNLDTIDLCEAKMQNALPSCNHVAFKRTKGTLAGVRRGVKIVDSTEQGAEASRGQDDSVSSPKIDEAQESLKLSSLKLRAAVKDPLPEALDLAGTLMSLDKDNSAQQPVEDDDQRAPQLVADGNGVVQANGGNEDDQHCCNHNAAPKPSLMARNDTAHIFEWNDSIDNLSGGSPSSDRRFILPSPRRAKVSPLKKYEFKKVSTRRKAKRWSALEEDTLRSGVQKYGVGNWRLIFDNFREIFEERNPGDLKDKWRNLTSS